MGKGETIIEGIFLEPQINCKYTPILKPTFQRCWYNFPCYKYEYHTINIIRQICWIIIRWKKYWWNEKHLLEWDKARRSLLGWHEAPVWSCCCYPLARENDMLNSFPSSQTLLLKLSRQSVTLGQFPTRKLSGIKRQRLYRRTTSAHSQFLRRTRVQRCGSLILPR